MISQTTVTETEKLGGQEATVSHPAPNISLGVIITGYQQINSYSFGIQYFINDALIFFLWKFCILRVHVLVIFSR